MDPNFDRRSGIGASEVYDCVEGNRLKVWRRKVEGWEEPDNPAMARGRRLERTVLEMYGEQLEAAESLLWIPTPQESIKHPSSNVLFATPDAYRTMTAPEVGKVATVDAKTTARYHGWGEEGTAEVPNQVLFQGITQMACTGLEECDIPVLMPSHDLRVYKILRDRETEGLLIEKVEQFWRDHIETKKPPIEYIDGSQDWMDFLNQRYPRETKGYLEADDKLEKQCRALQALMDHQGVTEEQILNLKNVLRLAADQHAGITFKGGVIHYKRAKDAEKLDRQKVIDTMLLTFPVGSDARLNLEQIIQNCTETKPGVRSLRPVWKDADE